VVALRKFSHEIFQFAVDLELARSNSNDRRRGSRQTAPAVSESLRKWSSIGMGFTKIRAP